MSDYPLEALTQLREQALEDARQELTAAWEAHRSAETKLREIRETLRAHQAKSAEMRRAWSEAPGRSIESILREDDYLSARNADEKKLRERETLASKDLRAATESLSAAQEALQEAQQERKVVSKHEERWLAERAQKESRRREAEADELAQRK